MIAFLERFDRPACLWLVLLVALMWWFSRRSLAGIGPIRSRLCMIVRAVVVILLVLVMAGTHKILKNDNLCVLFLLDQSRSVPREVRRQAERFIATACQDMKPNDRASVLTFDGQTNIEQLPSRPGPDGGLHVPTPFADGKHPDRTNIAQGLRMAAACALDSTNNRVVILSDGNQNVGDLLEETKTARSNKITVDVVPLRYEHGAEVVNEQLRAPAYANPQERVPLRLILRSDRTTSGTILLYQRVGQEEELLDLDPSSGAYGISKTLKPGRNAFLVSVPIKSAVAHEFRSEFIPDDKTADVIAQNNVACAFTNIEGPQTVLFIGTERDREDDQMLVDALRKEEINVQCETAESVNLDTSVIQGFSAIVLSNVPADLLSAAQQQAMMTYVRDLGGGLVMIGGDESFGAGGWQGSVVEDIMPVKFDVDAVKQIPRGALCIVMHSCEMPQGNKWGIDVAVAALKTISRLDYFGVVGWSLIGTDWEVKMQLATNKDAIAQTIRKMQNGDMPDFQSSMQLAYTGLMGCKDAAQRHMIIISDGDAAPPSNKLLNDLVGARITCSTVTVFPHGGGVGTMKRIAEVTKGRYYLLSRPGDEKRLPRIFVKEARIVRRPLIRDEPFKPKVLPNLSDIMVGIDENDIPELKGYVVTTPRKVVDVEMPLATHKGDPLLAHWRCGFGRTVAFTSGRWKHWGADWPEWASFSKLWAQTMRWVMQQGTAADFDVSTTIEGDEGHVVIESVDDKQGYDSHGQFVARVVGPNGTADSLPIVQTGPGRYEARFKVGEMGTYLVNIQAQGKQEGGRPIAIRTGLTLAYSPEFKDLVVNEALLREVADETAGRVLAPEVDSKAVFAHNLPPTISRTPVWDLLLKIAVVVFLLDVAFRRIAIDPVKVWASARGYVASLAGRFGAGKRAEATLTDLKTVRDKVRADRTARGDGSVLAGTSEPTAAGLPQAEPGPAASTRFEAETKLKKPARDLAESLGGHQAGPAGPAAPKGASAKEGPQESTTARLLKAKKRAKQRRDQQDQP
ncbi:MAG: VWA domain-containing protein [Phycisphaerae bacterium]|nr:VWA domain-containing protein [Phycisphaerae bacterium]